MRRHKSFFTANVSGMSQLDSSSGHCSFLWRFLPRWRSSAITSRSQRLRLPATRLLFFGGLLQVWCFHLLSPVLRVLLLHPDPRVSYGLGVFWCFFLAVANFIKNNFSGVFTQWLWRTKRSLLTFKMFQTSWFLDSSLNSKVVFSALCRNLYEIKWPPNRWALSEKCRGRSSVSLQLL